MKIKVWDIPTRLFHWLLVGAYIGAFFTSESEWYLEYHTVAGYIAFGLVGFRVLWGFSGNKYARFSDFIKGWGPVKDYIAKTARLKPPRYLGHNPAVGWIVLFMFLLTVAIAVSGIITYAGEEGRGFFAWYFSYETAVYAGMVHLFLTKFVILMIVVHVCAALFHDFILKENIILSMVTGTKEDAESWQERVSHLKPDEGRSVLRLGVWVFVAVMGGVGLIYLPPEGEQSASELGLPKIIDEKGVAAEFAPNETWKAECAASCHNAFHPTLLPAQSWNKLSEGLSDHFGDDVTLDEETKKEIFDYLIASSAEHSTSEASIKILRSIKKGDVPIRITEVPYWKVKHSEIKEEVFARKSVVSKSNCVACHPGSEVGSFEDKDIRIPN